MFGRKKNPDDDKLLPELGEELGIPAKPGPRPTGTVPTAAPLRPPMPAGSRPLSPDSPKPVETPKSMVASETRTPTPPNPVKRDSETRKLIVGREISLSGEITACDRLVVEGSVEANLANCRDIDIAESGLFKGSASIDDAEIRGRFEGTLNVRRRLLIRASGREPAGMGGRRGAAVGTAPDGRGPGLAGMPSSSPSSGRSLSSSGFFLRPNMAEHLKGLLDGSEPRAD